MHGGPRTAALVVILAGALLPGCLAAEEIDGEVKGCTDRHHRPVKCGSGSSGGGMSEEQLRSMRERQAQEQRALQATRQRARRLHKKGTQYINRRDYSEAVRYYRQALALWPGNGQMKHDLAWALYFVSESHYRAGRKEKCVPLLKEAADLQPKDYEIAQRFRTIKAEIRRERETPKNVYVPDVCVLEATQGPPPPVRIQVPPDPFMKEPEVLDKVRGVLRCAGNHPRLSKSPAFFDHIRRIKSLEAKIKDLNGEGRRLTSAGDELRRRVDFVRGSLEQNWSMLQSAGMMCTLTRDRSALERKHESLRAEARGLAYKIMTAEKKAEELRKEARELRVSQQGAFRQGSPMVKIGAAGGVSGGVIQCTRSGEFSNVVSGKTIYHGSLIKTDPKGRVQILLLDDTVFTMGPDSEMTIDEFVYDPFTQTGKVQARISKGIFRFLSGRLAKLKRSATKIVMGSFAMGIRGTDGIIRIDQGGDAEIHLLKGAVDLTSKKGSRTLEAGESVAVDWSGEFGEVKEFDRKTAVRAWEKESGFKDSDMPRGESLWGLGDYFARRGGVVRVAGIGARIGLVCALFLLAIRFLRGRNRESASRSGASPRRPRRRRPSSSAGPSGKLP